MTVIVNGAQVAKDSLGITDGSSEGKQIIRKKKCKDDNYYILSNAVLILDSTRQY